MGVSTAPGIEPTALLEVLRDDRHDLVLREAAPLADGFAKMKGRTQSLLDVSAPDSAGELGKLEVALGVLAVVLIWHHERASATMTAGRARVTTTGRYIS